MRLTACALGAVVGGTRRVALIETGRRPEADALYGSVAPPTVHKLHERIGLSEAALLRETDTAFSWGTRYERWANADWTQAYHQPLPVIAGVEMQHHLARLGAPLEPFLVTAQAARRGVFAHPAPDPRSPLARAEYGYQLSPTSLAAACLAAMKRVDRIEAGVAEVETRGEAIAGVRLDDGRVVEAGLYVDATGPEARLLRALGVSRAVQRRIGLTVTEREGGDAAPVRTLRAEPAGWRARTPYRRGVQTMTVCDPEAAAAIDDPVTTYDLGRVAAPWTGNCVGIGQAAGVTEPLTPNPILLLYRDVERLLDLVPLSSDQGVERREFNRRFEEDAVHAALFEGALFAATGEEGGAYRAAGRAATAHEKLDWKIAQWESRGILVAYDLEPYTKEDWLILHCGTGRRPRRYDRCADAVPMDTIRRDLAGFRSAIQDLTAKLPPSDRYAAQYLAYLERNP